MPEIIVPAWAGESSAEALSVSRTTTLAVAPVESITVTRANPGPPGAKNKVPRGCGGSGLPLTNTVSGSTAPVNLSGIGSGLSSRVARSRRAPERYGEDGLVLLEHRGDDERKAFAGGGRARQFPIGHGGSRAELRDEQVAADVLGEDDAQLLIGLAGG